MADNLNNSCDNETKKGDDILNNNEIEFDESIRPLISMRIDEEDQYWSTTSKAYENRSQPPVINKFTAFRYSSICILKLF